MESRVKNQLDELIPMIWYHNKGYIRADYLYSYNLSNNFKKL